MGNSKSQLSVPAPKKIIYFGVKAAGLPATMCLEVAGLPYEAQKVAMEEWKDLKPTTPTGVRRRRLLFPFSVCAIFRL